MRFSVRQRRRETILAIVDVTAVAVRDIVVGDKGLKVIETRTSNGASRRRRIVRSKRVVVEGERRGTWIEGGWALDRIR